MAFGDKGKSPSAGRAGDVGRVNGHSQENGVENVTLFEVVKQGRSATQVSRLQLYGEIWTNHSFLHVSVTLFPLAVSCR